jgi:hypothetical protein
VYLPATSFSHATLLLQLLIWSVFSSLIFSLSWANATLLLIWELSQQLLQKFFGLRFPF